MRGQKLPDVHVCGMQKTAAVLHFPSLPQAAPPGQSAAVLHVHVPSCVSHVPDGQAALLAHAPASAQLPDWGGYADGSCVLRWPIQIGCVQAFWNVYVYCVAGSHCAAADAAKPNAIPETITARHMLEH
ncbi:MAG: hypothetical protein KIT14_09225 [bacterium]|nr:hypothetical protein [bacterium]